MLKASLAACRPALQRPLLPLSSYVRSVKQQASMSSAALTFDKHGEPADVLQLGQHTLPELGQSDVHLQMLAVSD